jgi:hypothetical protein
MQRSSDTRVDRSIGVGALVGVGVPCAAERTGPPTAIGTGSRVVPTGDEN